LFNRESKVAMNDSPDEYASRLISSETRLHGVENAAYANGKTGVNEDLTEALRQFYRYAIPLAYAIADLHGTSGGVHGDIPRELRKQQAVSGRELPRNWVAAMRKHGLALETHVRKQDSQYHQQEFDKAGRLARTIVKTAAPTEELKRKFVGLLAETSNYWEKVLLPALRP
jgi:hypothetical protein